MTTTFESIAAPSWKRFPNRTAITVYPADAS